MSGYRKRTAPAKILVMGFMLIIFAGSILLSLPQAVRGEGLSYIDALFTATSAVCVTGLVVVDTGTYFSPMGQLVILGLIFIGSLGFMTMASIVFLFLGRKIMLRDRLVLREELSQDSFEGLITLVKKIIALTIAFELAGAMLLSIYFIPALGVGRGIYYSIFHAVSAFGNAGFDLMGNFDSLAAFTGNYLVTGTMMVLFVFGGIGFVVIMEMLHFRSRISLHTKMVMVITLILLALGWITIWLLERNNPETLGLLTPFEKAWNALFTAATPRTAGFNVIPTDNLYPATLFFIMVLMFIGASPASTGGGIKTTTFGIVFLSIIAVIHGREEPEVGRRKIPFSLIYKAIAIIFGSLSLVIISAFILSIIETDKSFLGLLFEVVSAFGTVGLSTGITPDLSDISKVIITVTMFAGRLGPLTLMAALSNQVKKTGIDYPYEKVLIG